MAEEDYSSEMEMDAEVLPSMWPENLGKEDDKKFNIDRPAPDQDMLEEVAIAEEPSIVDFKRLMELTNYTEKGSSQLAYLVKQWEARQANAFRLLNEQLEILNKQKHEAELKELEILEEHMFEGERCGEQKRPISILEDDYTFGDDIPVIKKKLFIQSSNLQMDVERDSIEYWKGRSKKLEKLLDASLERESKLQEKLQENLELLAKQSSPVEELTQILRRADNFLHFILQNAPVVIGHQDKELRYRFIYNHFPSLQEKDIIGKTDLEIFSGAGVKESQEFKQDVLQRGLPAKREINFETELFGTKTFLIYVEPVFSKTGETIGVNYMGMDITDQVAKREKLAKLREEKAVRNAMETELNKTIHITEETMRAKQMLATMSHEIRSPLTGVVSMAEILATTKLDNEQRQLLDVMISSGDLVLQLINDILDLSKVESGAMKLEATNFRPREVVKHVLQTAAASMRKDLTLEGFVTEDVPVEVVGDVLRIRQILTNLISNAIKFTHKGKVGVNLKVASQPLESFHTEEKKSGSSYPHMKVEACSEINASSTCERNVSKGRSSKETYLKVCNNKIDSLHEFGKSCLRPQMEGDENLAADGSDDIVWLHCDVYDTGIGIPEKALPTLFKKYMQASAAHARKYGGTGLGLAICKQLVELMGGRLTVSSQEHHGSTFSFILPCKILRVECSYDEFDNDVPYDMSDSDHNAAVGPVVEENKESYFHFRPHALGSLLPSNGTTPRSNINPGGVAKSNGIVEANCMQGKSNHFTGRSTITKRSNGDTESVSTFSENYSACANTDSAKIEKVANEEITVLPKETNYHSQSSDLVMRSLSFKKCEQQDDFSMSLTYGNNDNCGKFRSRKGSNTDLRSTKSKLKILLAEDNKVNVMVTQSMMKQLGYNIDVVSSGAEAVQAVQKRGYDLILMDVCMPVMDGLEATRLIRAYESSGNWDAAEAAGLGNVQTFLQDHCNRKRIPIIAMTANAFDEGVAECYANGMDSFIAKPITFQKLKEALTKYIGG